MIATTTERYDPVTFIHWLYWRLLCLEASPVEFQRLFENVAARAKNEFVRVRPYGKIGDRKCDGLYYGKGIAYQVFSPDAMKQAKTLTKIEEDLSGAVRHWREDLKSWVFVYNTRQGLAPDIPRLLKSEGKKYPGLEIKPLSDDDLWKIVRKLSIQDRTEILGPPPGHEMLFPLTSSLPKEIRDLLRTGRFVIVQDILSPINLSDAIRALRPMKPFAPPLFLHKPSGPASWNMMADHQRSLVEEAIARSREQLPRFAVFSLSPIPLAIHLGYLLSDRVEVMPFQFDRDRKTWCWDGEKKKCDTRFSVRGLPETPTVDRIEVAIRVSLSDRIRAEETDAVTGQLPIAVDVAVNDPDVIWLVHPKQITEFMRTFRNILRELRRVAPNCARIHLFYAGPTGCAIVAGQAINPRMNPPIQLYEYERRKTPQYKPVLRLE